MHVYTSSCTQASFSASASDSLQDSCRDLSGGTDDFLPVDFILRLLLFEDRGVACLLAEFPIAFADASGDGADIFLLSGDGADAFLLSGDGADAFLLSGDGADAFLLSGDGADAFLLSGDGADGFLLSGDGADAFLLSGDGADAFLVSGDDGDASLVPVGAVAALLVGLRIMPVEGGLIILPPCLACLGFGVATTSVQCCTAAIFASRFTGFSGLRARLLGIFRGSGEASAASSSIMYGSTT